MPSRLHSPDQVLAGLGEAAAGVGGGWKAERHPLRKGVGPAPDQSQRAQAGAVEDLQGVQLRIDRLGALEVEYRGQRPRLQALAQRGGVGHDPDLALRLPLQAEQRARHRQRHPLRVRVVEGLSLIHI